MRNVPLTPRTHSLRWFEATVLCHRCAVLLTQWRNPIISDAQTSQAAGLRVFATTKWSVVLAAGEGESVPAQRALETLCRAYWFPIYVYVRRKGYGPDEGQTSRRNSSPNWRLKTLQKFLLHCFASP
jgi:hypothetical protein